MEIINLVNTVITEASQIAESRRLTVTAVRKLDIEQSVIDKISIIVTELGTNLIKHTSAGGFFYCRYVKDDQEKIEIIALDKGKGISNIQQSMEDGYSTAGSPGTGLGSIRRLSDEFNIYSLPEAGSCIISVIYLSRSEDNDHDLSAFFLPKPGEPVSGDAWSAVLFPEKVLIMVSDGLGHGLHAAEASKKASEAFAEAIDYPLPQIMQAMHNRMRATRGAAAAVTEINLRNNVVKYCGIGNISASVLNGAGSRSMISHNGILGHQVRKIQEFEYPWSETSSLVMFSDGISNKWALEKYPALFSQPSSIAAAVLHRDNSRKTDDSTILIYKWKKR